MQKAKIKWAIEGDENSKFFHGFINNKFTKSRIKGLNINGLWVSEPNLVKSHIFNFYEHKFKNTNPNRIRFTSDRFKRLSDFDISLLEAPISNDEIQKAVWSCGGGKSLGPDGFTFKFIKEYWDTIGIDFINMVKRFEIDGEIPRGPLACSWAWRRPPRSGLEMEQLLSLTNLLLTFDITSFPDSWISSIENNKPYRVSAMRKRLCHGVAAVVVWLLLTVVVGDECLIQIEMLEEKITSKEFYSIDDKDVVSLCLLAILELVLLGQEPRHNVPDWCLSSLRNANVKWWPVFYATLVEEGDDKPKYTLSGFTWAFRDDPPVDIYRRMEEQDRAMQELKEKKATHEEMYNK
ncbi:hypothetical protein Tco_1459069 [Tanacetum coccineum]